MRAYVVQSDRKQASRLPGVPQQGVGQATQGSEAMTHNEALDLCYGTNRAFRDRRREKRTPEMEAEFRGTLLEMQARFNEMCSVMGIDGPSRRNEASEIFTHAYNLGLARATELMQRRSK